MERLQGARDALKAGDALKAILLVKAHLSVSTESAESLELLGIAQAQAGNRKVAVDALSRATGLDPARASAHYNLALCLNEGGSIDEAMEEVQAALFIKPDYPAALSLHKRIASRLKDRHGHSDEGFAVVGAGVDPCSNPSSEWMRLDCVSCGAKNFITARCCSRCGSYLPEEKEIIPVE